MRAPWIIASLALAVSAAASARAQPLCLECITVRVGPPIVLRGPAPDEIDGPFSQIKLKDGRFRGFTANGTTYAIDGATPWSMGGPRRAVIGAGPKGTSADCGNWLNGVIAREGRLIGLMHNEQSCDYKVDQTRKSMSIATSTDEGLSWAMLGTIISGTDTLTPGKSTGEGDCTMVDGGDSYLYAYCLRLRDWRTFVVRAPIADPSPGRWFKWDGAAWGAPALGGNAASLGPIGFSAATWADHNVVLLLDMTEAGMVLSLSHDKLRFKPLAEPLMRHDRNDWNRPAATELHAYPNLLGDDGANRISGQARLSYLYLAPGADFAQRFLVMHDIWLSVARTPRTPQAGMALTRWIKDADGQRWATTGPPVENRSARHYRHDKQLGYVMTAAPAQPSHRLDECVRDDAGGLDYRLSIDGCSPPFRYRRAAGFLYRDAQHGAEPLYGCVSREGRHFASGEAACEGLGRAEGRLGYVLAR